MNDTTLTALLIPEEGPLEEVELDRRDGLVQLQTIVDGDIQALPLPEFLDPKGQATAYINEEGKYHPTFGMNRRATDLLVPGVGLFFGDYIAGPFLLAGINPRTGNHVKLPEKVIRQARLIEREAA